MATTTDYHILDDLLDPVGQCLTPDVAKRIAALRASPETEARLDELAEKNSEGRITAQEDAEYAEYVEALDMIAILQAKARKVLKTSSRRK